MMNIGVNVGALGGHLAGWRHRDSWHPTLMRLDNVILAATLAERGKLDMIFLADGNGVRQMDKPDLFAANSPSNRPAVFEPVTLFAAVSQHTSHVGFVATATTTYEEPFTLARKFASLDHISGGRCGWNLVTTSYPEDARNFSKEEHLPREQRYERAREFADVVRGLWDSWAEDAFPQDQASGRYLEPSLVHAQNHKGKYFSVRGPLNCPRTPQGRPVIFSAGQSTHGIETSAYCADAVFASVPTKADGMAYFADVKGRMAKYGRSPDELKIMPGLSICVAATATEADELFDELQDLIPIELGVAYLSKLLDTNLSAYPLDGPLPEIEGADVGTTAAGRQMADQAKRDGTTIRQMSRKILASTTGTMFKGSPRQVADEMEDWYRSQACDGFMISNPVMPRGLQAVVDLLIPELQRRGLFRTEYPGRTLRETMGLKTPVNPYFAVPTLAAE